MIRCKPGSPSPLGEGREGADSKTVEVPPPLTPPTRGRGIPDAYCGEARHDRTQSNPLRHPQPARRPAPGSTTDRARAIYQTTSYVFRDTSMPPSLFNLERAGHSIPNLHPTVAVLEERISALEGASARWPRPAARRRCI